MGLKLSNQACLLKWDDFKDLGLVVLESLIPEMEQVAFLITSDISASVSLPGLLFGRGSR